MNRLGIRCLPQLLAACMAPMLACAPAYGSPLVFSENSSSNPWVLPAWTNLLASAMPTPATCADSQYGGSTSWSTLTDGSVGSTTPGSTIPYPSQMNTVVVPTNGKVVTFALDLSGTHSAGYDITAFDSYGLWDDPGREDQNYTLAYSTVSAPDTFTPITSVAYHTVNPGSGAKSTHIRLTDTAGYLALHVAQIRITFDTQENSGTGYSELVLTDSQQAITTLYESNSTNVWTLPSGTNLLDGATASPSSPLTNQGYGLSTTWTTLTDDSVGSATTASQGVAPANGSSVIFPLDISTNIKGYNLTSFDSYCAWQDSGRDNQDFAILYSTVAAPATFIPLTQVMNHTSSPVNTTHSRLTNNVTGFLATEVAALKFAFNNQENAWVGYREFIALGSAVPLSGTLTWAGLSGAAGSANWVTTADSNWMEGTSSSVYFSSDPLIFSSAGINSHINIPTALTAESLMFINDDTVPYIFSGQALTVTSDVTLSGSGTAVFGNALGAAGLTVSGTGSLTLAVNNTLTGTATVSSGTLNLASHGALGTASLTQTGGTVNFTSSAPVVSRLSGTGGTLVLGNPAEPGNTTLAVGDATTASYSGSIADASVSATGGLVKTGTGTLVLAGNNTYSGPTVINAGTLALPPSVTGINYFKVTGDSDSGITAINTYTHAINPSGSRETVNGIPFTGAGTGTLAADSLTAKTYVQAGGGTVTVTNSIGSSKFGDGAIGTNLGGWSGVTGNLLNLFSHFDLGGTPTRTVVLTGLAPNTWYDVRLYEKPWDTSSGRTFSVAYDVGNDGVVEYTSPPIDQNNPQNTAALAALGITQQSAWVQSYIYKTGPDQTSIALIIANTNSANTYHFYGISNQLVPAYLPANSAISIAAGATLDVSANPAFDLGSGASLTAAGTGVSPATIKGGTSISLGSQALTLHVTPTSFAGDTANPALTISQGALTLNGAITVNIAGSAPLGAGTYQLISQTSGSISGTPSLAAITGSGLTSGLKAYIQVSGGKVNLLVASNIITPTVTLTRHDGTADNTTYGDSLSFDVAVTPATTPPTGLVALKDGATTLGTYTLVSSDNGTCTITPELNALTAGSHGNIIAVYAGDGNFSSGASAALSPQSVAPRVLTIADASATNKIVDGTTAVTLNGTLSGVLSGDTLTLSLSGSFASSAVGVQNVISTSIFGGASAANYTLTQPEGVTAEILAAGIWTGGGNAHWANNGDTGNWLYGLTAGDWQNVAFDSNTAVGTVAIDWYKGTGSINLNSGLTTDITFNKGSTTSIIQSGTGAHAQGGIHIAADSANLTMNTDLAIWDSSATWTIGANRTLTINGVVNGGYGFTMNGPGTAVLTGANTYGGQTYIHSGTLLAANNTALGVGGHNGATMTFIRDGATLALQGGIQLNEHAHFTGAGVDGLGAIRSISGDNALTEVYGLDGNATIGVDADTLMIVGAIYHDSGSYGITKVGTGTLALSAVNLYTGATNISAGTLKLTSLSIGTTSVAAANSYAFNPAANNLLAGLSPTDKSNNSEGGESTGSVTKLTDAAIVADSADTYYVGSNAYLTYTLPTDASAGYDITQIHIYSGWNDGGRENITLNNITYSTVADPATFTAIPNSSVNYEGGTSVAKVTISATDGVLASGVYAIRFNFGAQENGAVGYRELEVLGMPVGVPAVGQLPSGTALTIAAGATFDVSAVSAYTLGSSSLAASGTGTTVGTDAAAITGAAEGTVNLGSQPVTLNYDGTHPALVVSQGTLTLGGNPFTVVVPGTALGAGVYSLIATSSAIAGAVDPTPAFLGNGVASGLTGAISISGNDVILTVSSGTGGSYATWAASHGIAGQPTSGDFDHDGISNLVEYALGLDPTIPNSSVGTLTGRLLSFAKGTEAVTNGDVTYAIEESDDLGQWTVVTPDVNNATTISYTLPVGKTKAFARLVITE